ncbi:hypothetical protein AB4Z10_10810 [Bosea sp. RAF48]|uniref:hypothetical protein n=1 Tax=Bosea sp. RAF48 TaxID=3237480 RepID=UPI003F8D9C4B
MPGNRYSPRPAAMASRLGHHLLLSLGIATATAVVATLPGLLSGAVPRHRAAHARVEQAALPKLALLRDGKIADRLDGSDLAANEGLAANQQVTPAALAMPMSVSWPEGDEWAPPQFAELGKPRLETPGKARHSPPARRTASPPERNVVVATPLVILPPAAATAIEMAQGGEESRDDSWSRFVVAPATKVSDAVSGAAGSVQAAGVWGLSQATSLLPRW